MADFVDDDDCKLKSLRRKVDGCGSLPEHVSESVEKHPLYEFKNLKQICTLGVGSFGRVTLVQDEITEEVMALKVMKKETIVELRQQKNIITEKNLLKECSDCAFTINLISTYNFPSNICTFLSPAVV